MKNAIIRKTLDGTYTVTIYRDGAPVAEYADLYSYAACVAHARRNGAADITEAATEAPQEAPAAEAEQQPTETENAPQAATQAAKGTTTDTDTEEEEDENTMTKVERIIAWFEENKDVFNDCIEELDSWNGYLCDDRYYSMDELSELYHDADPIELLNRAYFGYDSEVWHIDAHGEKEYGPFNPNRDYFTFNGYGNFVSADYKDYSGHLDEYFIEALNENREHIWTVEQNDELRKMLESLDDDENDDE